MASLEGNEGKLARDALAELNIDPQAKGFELFESPLDRTPLEVRLHQVRNPLLGIAATQAEKALGKNPEYQNLALEGIRRSVVANVEDRRRQEVGEGKLKAKEEKSRWFHFSASKAKGYLKQMWEADTWKERFTRTAVAGAAGALGVGLIGGGVGLLFVPFAGPLIGATVMGLSSSVPELYVRVNEGVDALFQKPEESLEAQMRGRMSKSIVDDLRKRNVIPRYREVYKEQLPRSEQRKADDLVRLLRADLDRGYARSGDLQKTIAHYNKVVASNFVSTIESDDWVHAAHSEVIADWLMPELDYCINGMGNWSSAPLIMPEEEMRKAFLQRTRLAA
ncbi:MAG: hypothetical protein KDK48_06310 [Chlamydiia bacterium]|nr:hypothetical protein [Chlamydiia bacterium]